MRTLVAAAFACLALASGSGHAELLRYNFNGTVGQAPVGTSVVVGDEFTGSWTIQINQTGEFTQDPISARIERRYELAQLTINLGNEALQIENAGGVMVSEMEVEPSLNAFWPSGFSSDYVVSSFFVPFLPKWGTSVWRFSVLFSYDGLGKWNDLALPSNLDLLADSVFSGIAIETTGTGPGSGVEIFGGIREISISSVPVPAMGLLFGVATVTLLWVGKARNKPFQRLPST